MSRWTRYRVTQLTLATAAIAIILLVIRSGSCAGASLRYYHPEGYVTKANELIAKGFLYYDPSTRRIEENPEAATPADRAWYEDSYLKRDRALFNQPDGQYRWFFLIEDNYRIGGVDPTVHRVELPFVADRLWRGDVYLNTYERGITLESSSLRTITLMQPSRVFSADTQLDVRIADGRDVVGERILLHSAAGPGDPLGRLFIVGNDLVVQNRVKAGRGPHSVKVQGYRTPPGRVVRLDEGDWLFVEGGEGQSGPETLFYVPPGRREAISSVRVRNGRDQRDHRDTRLGWYVDHRTREARPWVEALTSALDSAAQQPETGRLALFDLRLSMVRELQDGIGERFGKFCRRRATKIGRPFSAGTIVMDGRTAEVLATATYPWPEDLHNIATLSSSARSRLLLNQNLVRHEIGSAGKPFLLAAAADTYPFLLNTVLVGGHGPTDDQRALFHCLLPRGYSTPFNHWGDIDFRRAIEQSCNRYAVGLVTLALAARSQGRGLREAAQLDDLLRRAVAIPWPRHGQSTWRFGDHTLDFAPDIHERIDAGRLLDAHPTGARVECRTMDLTEQESFTQRLSEIARVSTYAGETANRSVQASRESFERMHRTLLYDLQAWSPLLDKLTTGASDDTAWLVRAAFQAISPERVNLSFNGITELREEFISTILGGNTSVWSNVQLAESLARIVTDRPVRTSMVHDVIVGGRIQEGLRPGHDAGPVFDHSDVRVAVLEGMESATHTGTAKALRPAIRSLQASFPGSRIHVFAKTGTPRVERRVPRDVAVALEKLIERGDLYYAEDKLWIRRSDGPPVSFSPDPDGVADGARGLRGRIADLGDVKDVAVLTRELTRVLSRVAKGWLSSDTPNEGSPQPNLPLYVDGGRLRINRGSSLFRRLVVEEEGAVLIFSIVRVPDIAGNWSVPTREALLHEDARVLSVSIHLEAEAGSGLAIDFAKELLPLLEPLLR